MNSSGWRKPTPGLCVAEQHAKAGEHRAVPKSEALNAAKRVAAHLGLKAPERLLLDLLGAYSQSQDWEAGQRPIVWPSNDLLIEQTGFSLSALKRYIRRLAEAGLIAFHNSPNGKRWGRRSADGTIMEAYGFDLSPMAEQAHHFDILHQRLAAERDLARKLKREITALRRGIAANIALLSEHASMPADALLARFDELLIQMPRKTADPAVLASAIALFSTLDQDVRDAIIGHHDNDETADLQKIGHGGDPYAHADGAPTGAEFGPHIQSTKQHQDIDCNAVQPSDQKRQGKQPDDSDVLHTDGSNDDVPKEAITPSIVFRTCPEFASWSHDGIHIPRGQRHLFETAERVRPMIGISETQWQSACRDLGEVNASAALAIIVDKTASGAIRSPAGYLSGMLRKAAIGELHLTRSFHGRLARQAEDRGDVCR